MRRSVRRMSGFVLGFLMLTGSLLSLSSTSAAQIGIGISVRIAPPALPVYAQPMCPGPGYFWTPGYWAWNDDGGYYWVPGTWVIAPVGMLWTPGYWGFAGGFYGWHTGYWGRHIGFYGGVNYGFGYGGVGFGGGEWRGGSFFYNRAVMNVNVTSVTNVYNRTVIVNNVHTSFNGPGGIEARPTREEEAYGREPHTAALSTQTEHERAASRNRQLFASENHGRPAIAATGRPGEFSGRNVERAKAAGEPYHAPKMSPREARGPSERNHGSDGSSRNEQSRNEPGRKESARNGSGSNDHGTARPDNHGAENRERKAAARENSNHNSKPKQEKRDQNKAQKQAKAEPKRNGHQERR